MLARRCFRLPQLPVSRSLFISRKFTSPRTMLQPRQFPTTGFEVIDPSEKVEEEKLPFYHREDYYPVRIGQVFQDSYQIVAKLGYGTSSTVWLCHDLKQHKYWTLKVHINTLKHNQEREVLQHLSSLNIDDPGRQHVRRLEDSFKLKGPHGEHDVFIMTPLGMSLRTLQGLQKTRVFHPTTVKNALNQTLVGLSFLHDSGVIHTDLHSDNLLIAITNDSILSKVEDNEINTPVARKQDGDRVIYVSQFMMGGIGPLIICDFGQARIGAAHQGNAMPIPYRAPEVILKMPWGSPVDVWSTGLLAWDLLEREGLFDVYDHQNQELNDAHHLACMTALLGPPPINFLQKSDETKKYWNGEGQWHGPVPLPAGKKLEPTNRHLTEEDKKAFSHFLKYVLTWEPEERLSALEAWVHPWVSGKGSIEALEALEAMDAVER